MPRWKKERDRGREGGKERGKKRWEGEREDFIKNRYFLPVEMAFDNGFHAAGWPLIHVLLLPSLSFPSKSKEV